MKNDIYIVLDKDYIAGPVTEEKPDINIYPIDKEGYAKYEKDVEAYKAHLASLPRIKRADNGEWKEGQELERDKDFTIKWQWYMERTDEWNDLDEGRAVNVFTKIRTLAVPISQPQQEEQPPVEALAVDFAEYLRRNNMSPNGFGGWGGGMLNTNLHGSKTDELFQLYKKTNSGYKAAIVEIQKASPHPQPLQSAEEDLVRQMWDEAFGRVWMQSTWTGILSFIQAKELGFMAFKMLNHSPKTDTQ